MKNVITVFILSFCCFDSIMAMSGTLIVPESVDIPSNIQQIQNSLDEGIARTRASLQSIEAQLSNLKQQSANNETLRKALRPSIAELEKTKKQLETTLAELQEQKKSVQQTIPEVKRLSEITPAKELVDSKHIQDSIDEGIAQIKASLEELDSKLEVLKKAQENSTDENSKKAYEKSILDVEKAKKQLEDKLAELQKQKNN